MTQQVKFVEGWFLNNPDQNLFDLEDTGEEMGHCTSETCFHYSHDPRGPVNRLTLKGGMMARAGSHLESAHDDRDPATVVEYYRLPDGRFLRLSIPFHFGVSANVVNELPDFGALNEEYEADRELVQIGDPAPREPRPERPPRTASERRMGERHPRVPRPSR